MSDNFLLIKSKINIEAANHIKKTYSNTSVHCSYYSCYQIFKHVLNHKVGKSDAEIKKQNDSKVNKLGSHEIVIELLLENIRVLDKKAHDSLRMWIYDLKNCRHIADYSDEKIDESKGEAAYDLAIKIDENLNKLYYYKK